jgi:hypothetical protein
LRLLDYTFSRIRRLFQPPPPPHLDIEEWLNSRSLDQTEWADTEELVQRIEKRGFPVATVLDKSKFPAGVSSATLYEEAMARRPGFYRVKTESRSESYFPK